MTAFHEVQLPVQYSRGAVGGVQFNTTVLTTSSGRETRNVEWQVPRGRWNISHLVKTPLQLAQLRAFFRNRRGRAHGFRFKDWTDSTSATDGRAAPTATDQRIGTGDGATPQFQLVKAYSDGTFSVDRTINKPVAGTVLVALDGVDQASGWSVDTTTGVITFDVAPGNGVAVQAGFEFDVPARFDTDLEQSAFDSVNSRSWSDIPIVELRA